VRSVDDVAQVQEEGRVLGARAGCVVGGHLVGDALLIGVVHIGPTGIADRVQADGSPDFDLLDRPGADQFAQLHERLASRPGNRPGLLRDPARHPRPVAAEIPPALLGRDRGEERMRVPERLPRFPPGRRCPVPRQRS
jgi:hypothetical protein